MNDTVSIAAAGLSQKPAGVCLGLGEALRYGHDVTKLTVDGRLMPFCLYNIKYRGTHAA